MSIRGFHHLKEAWHGLIDDNCEDEVMFGLYDSQGGCEFELAVRWHNLQGDIIPRLEIFSDGLTSLGELRDVMSELESWHNRHFTPYDLCRMLKEHGFIDLTKRERRN
jgi:hypothetical protein